jgi:methylmalonyl-CoA/ethylmalonyl-CoA epimerase
MLMAMINKIDHIGIAVYSIENVLPFYTEILQLQCVGFEEVKSQQVKVAFLSAGETKIELLEPISDQSAIASFLSKRGEGIHHIAFGVENLESRLSELKQNGVPLIDEIPRKGAAHANIAFLHPQAANKVLVELYEQQRCDQHDK